VRRRGTVAHGQWPGVWTSRWGGADGSLTPTSTKDVPGTGFLSGHWPQVACWKEVG
jgi:hypothetical protein